MQNSQEWRPSSDSANRDPAPSPLLIRGCALLAPHRAGRLLLNQDILIEGTRIRALAERYQTGIHLHTVETGLQAKVLHDALGQGGITFLEENGRVVFEQGAVRTVDERALRQEIREQCGFLWPGFPESLDQVANTSEVLATLATLRRQLLS